MSLIGHHTLNPTSDPSELATRAACAGDEHPPTTYNPVHDATWCRCGAVVIAGDNAPITCDILQCAGDRHEHSGYCKRHCHVCWLGLNPHMAKPGDKIALGPITLEPYTADDSTAEGWWGVNRSTGDAVFVTRDHDKWLLASERDRPWVAWLWVGWEDGARLSQRHPGYGDRYATAAEALHATKRVCANYYRRLGGDHADRWL
jgi:hypothetical protein